MEVVQAKRVAATSLIAELLGETNVRRRGKTREWIKRREEKGAFNNVIRELGLEDSGGFKEMMRMSYETFTDLLSKIYRSTFVQIDVGFHFIICTFSYL